MRKLVKVASVVTIGLLASLNAHSEECDGPTLDVTVDFLSDKFQGLNEYIEDEYDSYKNYSFYYANEIATFEYTREANYGYYERLEYVYSFRPDSVYVNSSYSSSTELYLQCRSGYDDCFTKSKTSSVEGNERSTVSVTAIQFNSNPRLRNQLDKAFSHLGCLVGNLNSDEPF